MSPIIKLKLPQKTVAIPEGKPVIVRWKAKNKQRPGISVGVGWIKRGEQPGTITLVHSAFATYDQAENEYPARWTIFYSTILDITQLKTI